MLSSSVIEKELERRAAMVKAVSYTIDRLYDISPSAVKSRYRRNEVHIEIGKAMRVKVYNVILTRKLIIEVLKSKGVRLIIDSGYYYFKGLKLRKEAPCQTTAIKSIIS